MTVVAALLWLLNIPWNLWTKPASLVALAYVLLRDVAGASPGKLALGLRVVRTDGTSANAGQRLVRNATLALPHALTFFWVELSHGLWWALVSTPTDIESVLLYLKRERVGDRLAGTMVVRRSFAPPRATTEPPDDRV